MRPAMLGLEKDRSKTSSRSFMRACANQEGLPQVRVAQGSIRIRHIQDSYARKRIPEDTTEEITRSKRDHHRDERWCRRARTHRGAFHLPDCSSPSLCSVSQTLILPPCLTLGLVQALGPFPSLIQKVALDAQDGGQNNLVIVSSRSSQSVQHDVFLSIMLLRRTSSYKRRVRTAAKPYTRGTYLTNNICTRSCNAVHCSSSCHRVIYLVSKAGEAPRSPQNALGLYRSFRVIH